MGKYEAVFVVFLCNLIDCSTSFFLSISSVRYILEGKELEFYMKKIQRKKGKSAGAA